MEKLYCAYCGQLLDEGCNCEQELAEQAESLLESLEDRQHQSGFYAFQDLMEMRRFER